MGESKPTTEAGGLMNDGQNQAVMCYSSRSLVRQVIYSEM
jgi:hypothetical protein